MRALNAELMVIFLANIDLVRTSIYENNGNRVTHCVPLRR